MREADFERLEKLQVIEELEALKEAENSLRVKLKINQREIRSLKEALAVSSASAAGKASIQVSVWIICTP